MRQVFLVLLAAGLFVAEAQAQDPGFVDGQWFLSPMGTVVFREDKDRTSNGGFGGHFGLGRGVGDGWAIEVNVFGNRLDGQDETGQVGIGVDLLKSFSDSEGWKPFWLLGTGYMKSNIKEGPPTRVGRLDQDNAIGAVGFGLLRGVGESGARFRSEVRYRVDFADPDNFGDWLLNLGFVSPFGSVKSPVAQVDTDGDGVLDGADLCPGTPAGASVDSSGCELDEDGDGIVNSKDRCPGTARGVRVDRSGCEIVTDSDRDGVADDRDRCPNTPRGTEVDANGCKVIGDSDGDGVRDDRDRCPNTKKGVRVDVNGCEIREEIKLPGVKFELNSATLTPESLSVLNDAVATLKRYDDITVEAEGHTDSTGNDAYNMSLSQRRAESVRDYLISRGIAAARVTARGFGETRPVADNSTQEGRQRNRRVTLRITSK